VLDQSKMLVSCWTAAFAVSTLGACRLGGASGNEERFNLAPWGGAGLRQSGQSGRSGNDSTPKAEAGSTSLHDVGAGSVQTPAKDSGQARDPAAADSAVADASIGGEPDADLPAPDAANSCGQKITGCDPIHRTGCAVELQMQCDVDLLATTPAGVCVFNAPSADPNTCLNIPPTESCPAGQSCVDATCHAICLCDSECEAGSCCSKRVGVGGLKVCAAC
jgi:hypothetical protein